MRRKDREVTDLNKITEIMKECSVCSLAFFDQEYPYIVPLNFGMAYKDNNVVLYFHGANAGTKLMLLNKNCRVGFEMHCSEKLVTGEKACDFSMEYESVCGNGIAEILTESEKIEALNFLMKQYTGKDEHSFDENEVKAVSVFKVTVNEIHGKILKR